MIVGVIGSVWLHDSVIIIMQGGYSVLVELSRLKLSPEDAAGWVRRRQGQGWHGIAQEEQGRLAGGPAHAPPYP